MKAIEFIQMCEATDTKEWLSPIEWELIEATIPFINPRNGNGFAETEGIMDPLKAYIELRKMFDGMCEPIGKRFGVKRKMLRDAIKREQSRHPHNATYPGRLIARIEYLLTAE